MCFRDRIWPNRVWPELVFLLTVFGQTAFGQFWCFSVLAKFSGVVVVIVFVVVCSCLLLLVGACWCLLLVPIGSACWWCLFVCVWWVWCVQDFWASPPDPSLPDPPPPGPPSAGPPLRRTAQNFALFLPFPAIISFFLCLSGCLLVEFWWCFRSPGAAGARARQPENSKRAHLRVLAFKNTTNNEKTPRETQKERNDGGKGKKKREILGPPPLGPPPFGAPPFGGPTLRGPTLRGPPRWAPTLAGPHQNKKLAKCGLAKFGQQKLAKFGQIRMAKCGQLTLANQIRMAKTGLAKCGRDLTTTR